MKESDLGDFVFGLISFSELFFSNLFKMKGSKKAHGYTSARYVCKPKAISTRMKAIRSKKK